MLPQFPPPLNNSDPVNVNVSNKGSNADRMKLAFSKAFSAGLNNFSNKIGSGVDGDPAIIYSLSGYNKGAAQWIHIFNRSGLNAPANGAEPDMILTVPALANFYWDVPSGVNFSEGFLAYLSTTQDTLTVGAEEMCACVCYSTIAL